MRAIPQFIWLHWAYHEKRTYRANTGVASLSQLGIGTQIVTRAGPTLTLKSATHENHPHGVLVYNFEVEADHTYFVGIANGGAWVHNNSFQPKWFSRDPDVAAVANAIEDRYPGHVVEVNSPNFMGHEADIVTKNAIIEVKKGGSGLTRQIEARLGTGYPVIGYSRSLGRHAIRTINAAGGIGTNSLQLLLDVIAP